uniref:Capsid protein n=1 Tax=Genomoviridae sp. TaxID=2202565 RepID=A0A8F5MJM5_9VIRU|nr:MAG: capsid protein [Genomoviridae sp.]
MAFRRSSKSVPRYRSRNGSRRSYTRKKATVRYAKRTYARRRTTKRMSTRRVLNVSSQKKRDTMVSYTNLFLTGAPGDTYITTDAVILPKNGATTAIGWIPTARPAETFSGTRGSKIDQHLRTASTIYAVGTKEKLIIRTNSSTAWEWRRICFTVKGLFDTLDATTSSYFRQTESNGMVRLVTPLPNNGDIFQALFRGNRNVDWLDEFNAPVDTLKVDLKSDKRRVIASGNDSGIVRHYNEWHPIHKNIVYRDDEDGEDMFLAPVSVESKQGAGDYFIIDMFRAISPQDSDYLSFLPNSTFYWHEK